MGEPPRLSEILLGWEQPIIYFVTVCIKDRRPVLANDEVFDAIEATVEQLQRWQVLAGVVMPDHIHLVVTPTEDRGLPISDFATGFKRLLRKNAISYRLEWQRGCFDRLLRSDESLYNKWIYIEQNPIRAGLVQSVDEWPYYPGSIAEQKGWHFEKPSVGEAVSFPAKRVGKLAASLQMEEKGKLAASPTERQRREANSFPYRRLA